MLQLKIRTVDTSAFAIFYGSWAVGVVGTNDPFTFLFEDKSTFQILPTSIQTYTVGGGTYGSDYYVHQYNITKNQIAILSSKLLLSIRRTYGSNYADQDIKEKNAKKVKQLAQLVLEELAK